MAIIHSMNALDTATMVDAAPAADPLKLDLQLCFKLYEASNLVTRMYRPLLEPLGLTYPQYLAMMALWEHTPRTVGDLGETLGLDSGTLTPLLKRLEAGGLISRKRDPADERRVNIDLTAEGRALRERALSVPEAILCQIKVPLADLAQLHGTLKRLIDSFEDAD